MTGSQNTNVQLLAYDMLLCVYAITVRQSRGSRYMKHVAREYKCITLLFSLSLKKKKICPGETTEIFVETLERTNILRSIFSTAT